VKKEQVQEVRDAFQSILRADYISISELNALRQLDDYYVDFLKVLPQVLNNNDSYITGRRGTGKTTLLMRAYYECLKTISPIVKSKSDILGSKRILPIYIDLSKCKEIFDDSDTQTLERTFVLRLVEELKTQLCDMFEADSFKFFKKNFSELETFNDIFSFLVEGIVLKSSTTDVQKETIDKSTDTLSANISLSNLGADAKETLEHSNKTAFGVSELKGCNVLNLLNGLGTIRREAKIDSIYIFLDEYSDLNEEEQLKFAELLKKLLGSKNNVFFKVGTITDRYNFGDKIIIGRDIYPISLDLCDFAEKYGGIVSAAKELHRYTEELIIKRLSSYAPGVECKDVFADKYQSLFERISLEAMGVPRTIGMILQKALAQAEMRSDVLIQLSDVNLGIKETRKIYFMQFQGAVQKKALPGFYMDMWNDLLKRALQEKNKMGNRPASHFLIDPVRKRYLNVFCENFIIHCLEDSRASKYGGNYVLYAFDYDICNENNIAYATSKDEFTAVRFIYDSVVKPYDGYFSKEALRSFRCPKCNKIYEEQEVAAIRVKRCFECDEKLEEIIHQTVSVSEGNYTEVEIKILGMIGSLSEEEAMTASQIGEAVGCSYQKVSSWCGRALKRKGLISVKREGNRNLYYDSKTDE